MDTELYNAAWEILSEAEDIMYDLVGCETRNQKRLLDRMMWERVQLDMLMGEEYGEADILEYRRCAAGA